MKTSRSLLTLVASLWILASQSSHAIHDENTNGLSDTWEKTYNGGTLFPNTFLPTADPDGDGWTNEQEADANTDPLDANPPNGHITPDIEITPATYWDPNNDGIPDIDTPECATITWTTQPGTLYRLQYSTTLAPETWENADESYLEDATLGTTDCHVVLTQPNGQRAEKLFWRVQVTSFDRDLDNLTNAEEYRLGTNPYNAYTDSDLLSDYQEVARYQTDPTNSDSDDDGTPDDADPDTFAQGSGITPGTPSTSGEVTYAPTLKWLCAERSVHYSYIRRNTGPQTKARFGSWSNFKAPFQNRYADDWDQITPLALSGLLGTLRGDFPYPANEAITPEHVAGRLVATYTSAASTSSIQSDYLYHNEVQIKLMGTEKATTQIKRHVMIINWIYPDTLGFNTPPTSFETKEFSIAVGDRISAPQTIDEDFEVDGGRHWFARRLYTPEFTKVGTEEKGWDGTGSDLWRGLAINETSSVRLEGFFNLDQAATDLLEIASIEGAGNVTLSGHTLPLSGDTFQVKGISATPDSGARIVLRLKAAPNTIFASMRVHVFEKRTIPVSIFRLWDSRSAASEVTGGIQDGEIIEALNQTYASQGNLLFVQNTANSGTIDLRHLTASSTQDLPALIPSSGSGNGKFSPDVNEHFKTAADRTQAWHPNRTKLTINIVADLDRGGDLGVAYSLKSACFIDMSVNGIVVAHEVGHLLDLATKMAGKESSHDVGPWPQSYAAKDTGLLYESYSQTMRSWIRVQDSLKVNKKATTFE